MVALLVAGLMKSLLTDWPEGMCKVFGPGLPMNRFWSLILANVPLVMTTSFPLRAPYELNSRGVSLRRNIQRALKIDLNLCNDINRKPVPSVVHVVTVFVVFSCSMRPQARNYRISSLQLWLLVQDVHSAQPDYAVLNVPHLESKTLTNTSQHYPDFNACCHPNWTVHPD